MPEEHRKSGSKQNHIGIREMKLKMSLVGERLHELENEWNFQIPWNLNSKRFNFGAKKGIHGTT